MKSMIKKRTWRAIYRLLDHVSPIDGDCGKLCGAACCTSGDESAEDLGIYLYPGEDAIHSRKPTGSNGRLKMPKTTISPIRGLAKFIL